MKQIVCLKWGLKYPSHYVNKLYGMVARNVTPPFNFYCITENSDGIRPEVKIKPLISIPADIHHTKGWWYKLGIFSPDLDLTGDMLFLDLDVVVTGNLDKFFNLKGDFCIIEDWNSSPRRTIYNSSVMRFNKEKYRFIWDKFLENPQAVMKRHVGDQNWITECLGQTATFWPKDWCLSFKYQCSDGLPNEEGIVIFHGRPNPDEIKDKDWNRYKKAPWINVYWKE